MVSTCRWYTIILINKIAHTYHICTIRRMSPKLHDKRTTLLIVMSQSSDTSFSSRQRIEVLLKKVIMS